MNHLARQAQLSSDTSPCVLSPSCHSLICTREPRRDACLAPEQLSPGAGTRSDFSPARLLGWVSEPSLSSPQCLPSRQALTPKALAARYLNCQGILPGGTRTWRPAASGKAVGRFQGSKYDLQVSKGQTVTVEARTSVALGGRRRNVLQTSSSG